MFIFFVILVQSYEAARLLQGMQVQGVRMTNVRAHTHVFGLQMP